MPGPGGGPSRRSHTKSRKGCKTCKRRHIRCDETFPQCKNCTKHQVRCDYNDGTPGSEDSLKISIGGSLPWTREIEKGVDGWRQTGQFPFPELTIYPPLQVQGLSRNDVRLLYHVCSAVARVTGSRTAKLGLWTEVMPKFLGLAVTSNCVMQAVLAFSTALLAWETNSEETRALGTKYSLNAHSLLSEASAGGNSDALLAALILLSWIETTWDRWCRLTKAANKIMAHIQAYPDKSTLSEFVLKQTITFGDSFSENVSLTLSEGDLHEPPKVYAEIQSAMHRLQSYLMQPELDREWISNFTEYISQIIGAKRAIAPKEQFEYLYHLRKLLLWAPVAMLVQRSGDMQSLLVLSHFYAVALRLEEAFPDVGAPYLGNWVLNPLEEILAVLQMCQANPTYASMAHTAATLIDVPHNAVNEYRSRRNWSSRQTELQPTIQQPYELGAISTELGSQFAGPYSYTPSLSPAFTSPTPHLDSPQVNSAHTPRSPYLQVPGSGVDSYPYSYSSPMASYQTTPTTTFNSSPQLSPGYKTSEDSYSLSQADYSPSILATHLTSEPGEMDGGSFQSYGMSSSISHPGLYAGGITGGTAGLPLNEHQDLFDDKGKGRSTR